MRSLPILFAAALFAGAALAPPPAAAADAEKCESATLANNLHARMKADGKSDADIKDILGSGMKRRVLRGRVADASGCSNDQIDKALTALDGSVKG